MAIAMKRIPLLKGGQGRSARDIEASAKMLLLLGVILLILIVTLTFWS